MPAVDPVRRDIDDEAVLGQPLFGIGCRLGLVLDDQDAHCRRKEGKKKGAVTRRLFILHRWSVSDQSPRPPSFNVVAIYTRTLWSMAPCGATCFRSKTCGRPSKSQANSCPFATNFTISPWFPFTKRGFAPMTIVRSAAAGGGGLPKRAGVGRETGGTAARGGRGS